ncbi:hypothetical protein QBC38DRAFT_548876 [Podospora fimiseda]|uniref:Geranylgeranyl pyrophosphate synthetase n=1 Tax=Podospora fimiseda TaxID=252190 RepID=A0AAN7BEJ8_9PEZI|nr:hypothetical protein QBC38DRAFT_548876 [Podospora fimiseda]
MTSQQLLTICRSGLDSYISRSAPAKITDFKQLASYTWLDNATATISVPGSPPLWSPPSSSSRPLQPDSGTVFIDQNAARCPQSPLEPLFRALFLINPEFSLSEVDIITDRNNIRKLLRFVQASSNDSFRIRVEVVGQDGQKPTALFTRVEPKNTEVVKGFRGFGHNFEKVYTKSEAGMTGYHQVLGYNFGGLRCVVRCETDGYIGDTSTVNHYKLLSDAFGGLSVSETEETTATGLTILRTKNSPEIDVSSIMEIKTRAAHRTLNMEDTYPQLWVSQTKKLAVGYHRKGVFTDVQVRDVAEDLVRWEAVNRGSLEKLAGLMTKIIDVVRQDASGGSGRALVEYSGGSSLKIVADHDGKPVLPKDLYGKWADKSTAHSQDEKDKSNKTTEDKTTPTSLIPLGTPFSSDMEQAIKKGWSFTLKDIMADFKNGKEYWEPEEATRVGFKPKARDAAFRLVYILLSGQVESRDKSMAYNAVLFVVSHEYTFGPRTRQMVRAAFEGSFSATPKQKKNMDEWIEAWPIEDVGTGDETTEVEMFYGSDDSDW